MWVFARGDRTHPSGGTGLAADHERAPRCGAFHSAPERTRTATDHSVHKALNRVRELKRSLSETLRSRT